VLAEVDQLHSIYALAVTLAQPIAFDVTSVPGLSMRRLTDLHLSGSETAAVDGFIIVYTAHTAPQSLRRLILPIEAPAEPSIIPGYCDNLAGQVTATSNQLRDCWFKYTLNLEQALTENISREAVLRPSIKTDGTITSFPVAAYLEAYARLALITRRSGRYIRSEQINRGGIECLKDALFIPALTSLRAASAFRSYYGSKPAQGKRHDPALIYVNDTRPTSCWLC